MTSSDIILEVSRGTESGATSRLIGKYAGEAEASRELAVLKKSADSNPTFCRLSIIF